MTLEMITGVRTAKTDFSNLKKIVYFKLKGFLFFFFLIFMQNEGDYLSKVYFQIQLTVSSRTKLASVQFFLLCIFLLYS